MAFMVLHDSKLAALFSFKVNFSKTVAILALCLYMISNATIVGGKGKEKTIEVSSNLNLPLAFL